MYMQEMIWFTGVVEDISDPSELGRLRVRCIGYHTENKGELPTADLPWAIPMQPITSAAMQGIGQSPTGIVQGTHVVGFFRDGKNAQEPVVMGTLAGYSGEQPKGIYGYEDPDKKYPGTSRASISGLATHISGDINPLAKGDGHTQIDNDRGTDSITDAKIANTTDVWQEPSSPRAATYPNNHVMETESGHVKEYDDTPKNERIHEYHTAGTFYEIDSEGTKFTKVVKDHYTVVLGNDHVYVKGNVNLTIDDNCNTYIKGDWNIQVDGKKTEVVTGAVSETYKDTKTETVTGTVSETYESSQTTNITGNLNLDASINVDIDAARIDLN